MMQPYRGIVKANYIVNRNTGVPRPLTQRFPGHDFLAMACVMWLGAHEDDVIVTEYQDGMVEVKWRSPYTGHDLVSREPDFINACRMAQQRELEDEKRHGSNQNREGRHGLGALHQQDERRLPLLPSGADEFPVHGRQAEVLEPPGEDRHRPQEAPRRARDLPPRNAVERASVVDSGAEGDDPVIDSLVDAFVDEMYRTRDRMARTMSFHVDRMAELLGTGNPTQQEVRIIALLRIKEHTACAIDAIRDHTPEGQDRFNVSVTALLTVLAAWESDKL